MEKGNNGNSLLGWMGLLGLLVAVGVGVGLGYLEAVRRTEMQEMSNRLNYLQTEIFFLKNLTDHLQQQLQVQEKKLEEDKQSQYYDDNTDDYYDEDSYDEYRDTDDGDTVQDTSSANTGTSGPKNRTRRNILHQILGHRRRRSVAAATGDRYNLIISEGPRRSPTPRVNEVKAVVVIDPSEKLDGQGRSLEEHVRHPGAFRPYTPPPYPDFESSTTRRPRIYHPGRQPRPTPSFEEHIYKEERVSFDKGDEECFVAAAAQFGSDSTPYRGRQNHEGNHRMYHPDKIIKHWVPHTFGTTHMKCNGSDKCRFSSHFEMNNGHLTVITPGLYYVYAQILYAESRDTSGFMIYVNNVPQLQCTVTTLGGHSTKQNSCYTGGLLKLQPSDKVYLKEIEGHRYTVFEPTKSFFGLFRVANIYV